MDPVENPFNPGAGTRPPALVGRDKHIQDIDVAVRRLAAGRSARGQLLTGLRGVGKTVLLNEFEHVAERNDFVHAHIEVAEDGRLPPLIASAFRRVLLQMDAKRRIGERLKQALGVLKAFSLKLPDGPEIGLDIAAIAGLADSGDLAEDLAGLFVEVGNVARENRCGVLLTMDELHYVPLGVLSSLIMGLHRANQLGLSVLVAGAGLPSLPTLAGEAKSYAERMFVFPEIGRLNADDAATALSEPAERQGVTWEGSALEKVVSLTEGYPYFLQEFGKQTWDIALGPHHICEDDVDRAVPLAMAELDTGFFQVRTGRLSDQERAYLRAMAEFGSSARSADVARLLGKTTTASGPVRDRLLKKALCYSPRWGELEFTVPMFDGFMKRWLPSAPLAH